MLGSRLMFSDLEVLAGKDSKYENLLVMPHLDHANPWDNEDILFGFVDQFASVMCDASEKPLEENIRLTAEYVERVKGRVVVEGAVDEISSTEGGAREKKTTVEDALTFVSETGVDIIVPNLGTEHRSVTSSAHYDSEQARKISKAVGNILCLHGSSSVNKDDLSLLPGDGIVKINLYTALAYAGGKAVVNHVLNDLGNVLTLDELKKLVDEGVLGENVLKQDYGTTKDPIGPKLAHFTNPPRGDAWFNEFKEQCKDYMRTFNYIKFAK
jgi:fructose/tagatose bisphosphate aldolase